jgi:hypothetical protein
VRFFECCEEDKKRKTCTKIVLTCGIKYKILSSDNQVGSQVLPRDKALGVVYDTIEFPFHAMSCSLNKGFRTKDDISLITIPILYLFEF